MLRFLQRYPDKKLIFLLAVAFLFSAALVIVRVKKTQLVTYFFLLWNLFLAVVPLVVAYLMYAWLNGRGQKVAFYAMAMLWLLFYPNAPYIITDFIHLKARHNIPLWYDTLLIFSFAWNGFVAGLVSVRYFHLTALRFLPKYLVWFVILVVFVLSSLGIYLGRFLRWNSWDILSNPMPLLTDIFERVSSPEEHPRTMAMIMLFSVFSFLAYLIIIHLPKGREKEP
jgi:uncharacterized membrane protein